jgi:UPF0716 family protein affecting phage T7 exclusion
MSPQPSQRELAMLRAAAVHRARGRLRRDLAELANHDDRRVTLAALILKPPGILCGKNTTIVQLMTFVPQVRHARARALLKRARISEHRTVRSLQPIERQRLAAVVLDTTTYKETLTT